MRSNSRDLQGSSGNFTLTKRDVSLLLGNGLDHFDISLYSFLAPLLAPHFFPKHEPVVQLILTYGIVVLSFCTEFLGVFWFGLLAQRRGPGFSLSFSLLGVGLSTVLMGLTPNYDLLGYGAPLILVILRIARAIFASGESTISRLYILEGKPLKTALRASYWYHASTMWGILLASALSFGVIHLNEQNPSLGALGWRVCFILGGVTALFGRRLRRLTWEEENSYKQKDATTAPNIWLHLKDKFILLIKYRSKLLCLTAASSLSYLTYTIPFVFMNTYVPLITDISLKSMMSLNTVLLVLDALLIPLIGPVVARFKPQHVLLMVSFILSCTFIPLFTFLENASLNYVIFVRLWVVVWGVIYLCPLNYWSQSVVTCDDKYFLVGIGNAFGSAFLGRWATPLCLWLWHITAHAAAPAIYMTLVAILALGALWFSSKGFFKENTACNDC